jgi:hypothetical protein
MGNLAFLLYGKGHAVPASGLCPHEGRLLHERIPRCLLIRIPYADRLLARDLLFDRAIVRRETPVETGMAGDFSGYSHFKEA